MTRSTMEPPSPYKEELEGLLSFTGFPEAETTIKRLESLRRKYRSAGDLKGVEYCRRLALTGRRRAEFISMNKRVGTEKRLQKKEIAAWFRVWLETPELFDNWLELRKRAPEFRRLFVKDGVGDELRD
ncbi:MAG TPA: hypothetical protein VLL97_03500 [Acidobacteriota bacterium]|nr:hypothetical protein [Acidobacteriota bacterium]